MTFIYIIIAIIVIYLVYFKLIAPFVDHANKPYIWHSARMVNLPNFRHKCRYIYNLKELAMSQEDSTKKESLLLICTDIATDLKFGCKDENKKEKAEKILKGMLDIYHKEI